MGDLRWSVPIAPKPNRTAVQEDRPARSCPQSNVAWQSITYKWLPDYILNGTIPNINMTSSGDFAPPGPTEAEDCLFLDVFVPKAIFERPGNGSRSPVLVWIHGDCCHFFRLASLLT